MELGHARAPYLFCRSITGTERRQLAHSYRSLASTTPGCHAPWAGKAVFISRLWPGAGPRPFLASPGIISQAFYLRKG